MINDFLCESEVFNGPKCRTQCKSCAPVSYQKKHCRFGNGGGNKRKPEFVAQVTASITDAQFEYLAKQVRLRNSSLADEMRHCINVSRDQDQ
jgi:hypothetical protein